MGCVTLGQIFTVFTFLYLVYKVFGTGLSSLRVLFILLRSSLAGFGLVGFWSSLSSVLLALFLVVVITVISRAWDGLDGSAGPLYT